MDLKTVLFSACLAPAVLAQAAAPEAAARAVRIVPLTGFPLTAPVPRGVPLPWFVVDPEYDRDQARLLDLDQLPQPIGQDQIAELLHERFADRIDAAQLVVDEQLRALRLIGDADAVDAAAQFVATLEAALVVPVTVDAWLIEIPDARIAGDAKPVFSAAQRPELREALWHGRAQMVAGSMVELGAWETTPLVRRLNVEVAQEMGIANPVRGTLNEGVRLALEVHALAGSDELVVFGQMAFASRRGPIRSESTGLVGQPSIDVVEVDSAATTFSARVGDGGGVVVWHAGEESTGTRRALVIQLRRAARTTSDEGLEVLPIGALVRAGLVRGATYAAGGEDDALLEIGSEPYESGATIDPDALMDLVGAALGDAWEEGTASMMLVGEALVVVADADGRRRARELVAGLADALLVNTGVVARTAVDGRTLHEVAFPALLGRPHVAVRGIETSGVVTMWSEVAQKQAQLVPRVERRFAGLVASVVPTAGARGMQVDAQLDLAILGAPRMRPLEGDRGGLLSLQGREHTRFQYAGGVERGQVLDLGEGPRVDGVRTRQTLEIR